MRTVRLLTATSALLLALAAPAAAERYTAGSAGLGDPYFPFAGNGGYDAVHYDLDLAYDDATDVLEGRVLMTATATQDLDQFNLDFRAFDISSLKVNKHPARFVLEGEQELVITPRPKLKAGQTFTVETVYSGVPPVITDPDQSIEGWIPTSDGAFVVNEPQGSPGWFPVNDIPTDKATYTIDVTVPEGRTAISNGVLVEQVTAGGKTTWRWREDNPMASYLTTATNGIFNLTRRETADGIPIYDAVDPTRSGANLAREPEIIAFLSGLVGPYPFDAAGGTVDAAPNVGYALESQTKANYSSSPGLSTVVHEIAHQWFGNSVTLSTWNDIWLNEGFARWSEWRWTEAQPGGRTAQQQFDISYATPATNTGFWNPPAGDPGGPELMFDGTIYTRGALTIQALRQKIGETAFSTLLKRWYADNKDGNVTTADFVALSEEVSGQQLDAFFQTWLYTPGKPTSW
jgi:aminopeptidase N